MICRSQHEPSSWCLHFSVLACMLCSKHTSARQCAGLSTYHAASLPGLQVCQSLIYLCRNHCAALGTLPKNWLEQHEVSHRKAQVACLISAQQQIYPTNCAAKLITLMSGKMQSMVTQASLSGLYCGGQISRHGTWNACSLDTQKCIDCISSDQP